MSHQLHPSARMHLLITIVAGLSTARLAAEVPIYSTFELQVRSNFTVNGGGFNLPGDVFFANATPALNDTGRVTVRLDVIGTTDQQGIWLGANGAGRIVFQTPVGGFCSDPSINASGLAVFEQSFTSPDGIFFYDSVGEVSDLLTDRPIGANDWGSPIVNDLGHVGYRAGFLGDYAYYAFNGVSATLYVAMVDLDSSSPYSYLFTADFNNAGQIAGKARLGGAGEVGEDQPDQIHLFSQDGSSTLIAEDRDSSGRSKYSRFDNSVSVANNGLVAFAGELALGGRGVFRSDGATTVEIATTNQPEISEIEFFGPAINDAGMVVFRAKDAAGFRTVFVSDGQTLRVVVREHDVLPTDLGPGRVDQHDTSPVFGGSITINAAGDVAFHCGLTPENDNQIEWGSAIYIAYAEAPCPADTNADGQVDTDDFLNVLGHWGVCPSPCPPSCMGDTNDDCVVNADDFLAVLGSWGPCPGPAAGG